MKKSEQITLLKTLVRDQSESIRELKLIIRQQVRQIDDLKQRNETVIGRFEKEASEYHQNCYAMYEEIQELRKKAELTAND